MIILVMVGPPFTLYTDNNPLTYVMTSAKLDATGLRWVAELCNYGFVIRHRPRSKHQDADYLSMHPLNFEELKSAATCEVDMKTTQILMEDKQQTTTSGISVDFNT